MSLSLSRNWGPKNVKKSHPLQHTNLCGFVFHFDPWHGRPGPRTPSIQRCETRKRPWRDGIGRRTCNANGYWSNNQWIGSRCLRENLQETSGKPCFFLKKPNNHGFPVNFAIQFCEININKQCREQRRWVKNYPFLSTSWLWGGENPYWSSN